MLQTILHIISIWIIVLPVTAGFINYKGLNRDSRWIFFLVCIALVPQLLTFILQRETAALNISYNLYTPIEFAVFFFLFYNKAAPGLPRRLLQGSLVIYTIVCAWLFISQGIAARFLNSLVCVNNLLYVFWILFYLKEQYSAEEAAIHSRNPFAWYLLAMIIYAPCSLLTFALYYYIRQEGNTVLLQLSVIQDICNILLYILFTTGLFLPRQKSTPAV